MIDLDYLYDRVTNDNLSIDEFKIIIKDVTNGTSFKNSSFDSTDLYIKIAKDKKCTDELIILMAQSQIDAYRGREIHKILNFGTKSAFDSLWDDDNQYGILNKLWRSKHADTKQLETFWKKVIAEKDKNVDARWLLDQKHEFFRHPNAPTKIINRQLKNKDSLLNIALNPAIEGKALDTVASYARVQRHDGIFENLTRNRGLSWKVIAEKIDLKEQLQIAFGDGGFLTASFRRKAAIFEFFRRKDTPEKAKLVMFKLTGDEEWASDDVKEMFLF